MRAWRRRETYDAARGAALPWLLAITADRAIRHRTRRPVSVELVDLPDGDRGRRPSGGSGTRRQRVAAADASRRRAALLPGAWRCGNGRGTWHCARHSEVTSVRRACASTPDPGGGVMNDDDLDRLLTDAGSAFRDRHERAADIDVQRIVRRANWRRRRDGCLGRRRRSLGFSPRPRRPPGTRRQEPHEPIAGDRRPHRRDSPRQRRARCRSSTPARLSSTSATAG